MAKHNTLGKKGEELAIEFLIQKGYKIIEANWQEKKFEIDIIARDKNELVFVEVKTRSTNYFGNPAEAVTISKQIHLIEGANYYLVTNEIDLDCRFDVVAIVKNNNEQKIEHIKDAFYPELE